MSAFIFSQRQTANFDNALAEYDRRCHWDEATGNPTRENLIRLGLDWVADQFE